MIRIVTVIGLGFGSESFYMREFTILVGCEHAIIICHCKNRIQHNHLVLTTRLVHHINKSGVLICTGISY